MYAINYCDKLFYLNECRSNNILCISTETNNNLGSSNGQPNPSRTVCGDFQCVPFLMNPRPSPIGA